TFAAHLGALDQVRILDAPSFDHPGGAFAILLGENDASMDLAKHRQGVQIEHLGCFTQRDFATLGPLAVRVDRYAVRVAETPHTRLRPPVQSACSFSCSVEQTGNGLVRHARDSRRSFTSTTIPVPATGRSASAGASTSQRSRARPT